MCQEGFWGRIVFSGGLTINSTHAVGVSGWFAPYQSLGIGPGGGMLRRGI